jgi:hypothetical protein
MSVWYQPQCISWWWHRHVRHIVTYDIEFSASAVSAIADAVSASADVLLQHSQCPQFKRAGRRKVSSSSRYDFRRARPPSHPKNNALRRRVFRFEAPSENDTLLRSRDPSRSGERDRMATHLKVASVFASDMHGEQIPRREIVSDIAVRRSGGKSVKRILLIGLALFASILAMTVSASARLGIAPMTAENDAVVRVGGYGHGHMGRGGRGHHYGWYRGRGHHYGRHYHHYY